MGKSHLCNLIKFLEQIIKQHLKADINHYIFKKLPSEKAVQGIDLTTIKTQYFVKDEKVIKHTPFSWEYHLHWSGRIVRDQYKYATLSPEYSHYTKESPGFSVLSIMNIYIMVVSKGPNWGRGTYKHRKETIPTLRTYSLKTKDMDTTDKQINIVKNWHSYVRVNGCC